MINPRAGFLLVFKEKPRRDFFFDEQLQIQFTGALGASVTIDVYCHMASAVEVSSNGVRKISMN